MKRVILRLSHHLYHEKNGVPFCAFRYFFALFAPLSPSPTYLSPFPLPPSPITLLPLFFYECARLAPYELYMSGHHPATVRRAGRKRGAIFESSEALAEQPAVERSAVELCIDAAPGEIIPPWVLCPWRAHLLASTLPAVARATAACFVWCGWMVGRGLGLLRGTRSG